MLCLFLLVFYLSFGGNRRPAPSEYDPRKLSLTLPLLFLPSFLPSKNLKEGECDDLCPDLNEELDCVRVKGYALIAMDPQVSDFENVTGLLLENIEDIISGGELTASVDSSAVQCMGFVNGGLPGYDGDDEVMLLSKEVAQVAQEQPVTDNTAAGKGGKGGGGGEGRRERGGRG